MKNTIATIKIYYKKTRHYLHIASLFLDWLLETAWHYFSKALRIFLSQPFFAFLGKNIEKIYFKKIEPHLFSVLAFLWKKWVIIRRKAEKKKWSSKILRILAYIAGILGYVFREFKKFFLSLSTWKRVFATIVIFSLIYQNIFSISGVSADDQDPIENVATPEMRMLEKSNPDLMKTDTFQKRKELTEFSKEKAGEVNYYLGLVPKTKEDRIKKKEAEILLEAQEDMKSGWFGPGETLEQSIINYADARDEKTQVAAKNLIQALKSKNLWGSFTDGTTGQETEISTALENDGGEIQTTATPYEMKMDENYSGIVRITDNSDEEGMSQKISSEDREIPEPKISKVSVGASDKIMVDKTPEWKEEIEMRPVGANPSRAIVVDNKVIFKEAFVGMDVVKSSQETGLKEDVIIKNPSASSTLSYKLKTTGLDMRIVDGKLQFFDIFGNLKFTSDKPFIIDKDGKRKNLEYTLGGGDLVNQKTFTSLDGGNVENQEEVDRKKEEEKVREEREAAEWEEAEREKNSPALERAAKEIGEMLEKSAEWVKNLFSREEIEKILGRKIIDESQRFDSKDSPLYQDAKKTRYYTVSIKMDFSEMSYPINLDPTINVNLQDQGQATFHADYSEGSTSGDQGFMNGYGAMTRSSEPFLPEGGQRGYIPMDSVWTDYSGNGYNLTASGGATFAEGKFSQGGTFDGTDDYAYSTNAGYNIPGLLTISAWFKTTATVSGNGLTVANLGNAATGQWRRVLLSSSTVACLSSYNGGTVCKSAPTGTLNDGNWHHIVGVFDGTSGANATVYIDGTSASGALTQNSFGAFQGFFVGTNTDGTDDFNGKIDEAVVWARNLSAAEIAQIYYNGRVENTDPSIVFVDPDGTRITGKVGTTDTPLQTNSNWYYYVNSNASAGSQVFYTSGATLGDVGRPGNEKAYIEYAFTGTEVWIGIRKNSVQRFVKAIVDEGASGEVVSYLDLYNPNTLEQQKVLIATGLTNGAHTARIYPQISKNISSSPAAANNPLYFDYFEYYTSGYELAQKSAISINSRATSGLDFTSAKDSPAVSYDARGNIPANASGTQERGTWSSWVKTDFAWNADNAPHYVWSNENARLFYLYDGSTNGNWYFDMYNGTNWTTVRVKSANYTSGNTFASGDVFHLAVSWDATVGTNLYVNNVKTSYVGTWTAQALTGNMKIGGDEKTKLLLHGDGQNGDARDVDGSGNGYPLTFYNNAAKVSTTQSKFGGSAYSFDGTNSFITTPDSDDWSFGTGNFTIDMWVNFNNFSSNYGLIGQLQSAVSPVSQFFIYMHSSGAIYWRHEIADVDKGFYTSNPLGLQTNTWYHMAFVRNGTQALFFLNGVSQSLTASTAFGTNDLGNMTGTLNIGATYDNTRPMNGYLDEVRVTKGVALWTSNFTPPTGPYHSNMIIAEPTILNYVLTDAEVNAIYASPVSMGEMINGAPGSAAIDTQKKLFSAAKRTEELTQNSKSLLFNFSGVQTADARVGAGAGSLYKTTAPTGPTSAAAMNDVNWVGNWSLCATTNCKYTSDPQAYATYTTAGNATEIWTTYNAYPDYAIAEYIIDEGTSKEVRTKVDQYKSGTAEDRYALLATGLENTTHTIKVRMLNSKNLSANYNRIIVGLGATANKIFLYGTTPDIATQTMVVNGKPVSNVLVQDYATMPTATNFSPKGNISQSANEGSISVWVQTAWAGNDSTNHYIFESRSAAALSGISLFKTSGNLIAFYWYNATTASNIYSPALTASNWAPNIPHHIVIKWWRPTSTTVGQAIYLDGVKVAETKSVSLTPNASSLFMIGNATTATSEVNDFDGSIYDFSVWSWAFDDGGVATGSMVSPTSDVGKSYSGYALGTDEDLSAQVDGATSTFKLKEKLERNQPNDPAWISTQNRVAQNYFGYNMAYDSARSRWYTVLSNYVYYTSGPDPEKSTWNSAYTGAAATVNNFTSIYYDSAYDRWVALGTLTGTGEWSAYLWYSSSNDPTTSTWTRKTISAGSNSESPNDLVYDSANSRWLIAGSIRVEPDDTPNYAIIWYSSGADLATATWSGAYISTASSGQLANGITYDSVNNYWYVAGYYYAGVNTACIWYSTNPIGGTGAWTRVTIESGGTPQATKFIYDSANSRWLVSGSTYSSTYDASLWYSSGNNLSSATWIRKDLDTDSEQEYAYSIVKDPNQNKYYLSSVGASVYGFWPVQISSESSSTLPNSISVKSEGVVATVSSAKTGTFGALETAIDQDDASLEIKKTFYEPDAYDKLLIHSDTTDGATSFGDSTTGKTITVAGNTHHEKDQAKIGQTSMYFDGTGDYLSLADSDDWNFGSGDFTVDAWAYYSSFDTGARTIAGQFDGGSLRSWAIYTQNNLIFFDYYDTGGTRYSPSVSWTASTSQWYHIAVSRNGNNLYFFVNGTQVGATQSVSQTIRNGDAVLTIGGLNSGGMTNYMTGYLDEFRISKGIARWTAAFDPLDPADESEIDTNGGYLTVGRSGSNRKLEVIEYSAYNASTNTFTLSQRGDSETTATDWPSDTPIEVGGTATLSAAPAEGEKVLANYNYQGDELDRDRGQIKSKSGQNNFLDYTASAATGWALSGDTANKSGRQTITTQVAGQNAFGYFYGAELGYIFSGDTTNGGVAMIVVDEGTGNERRIRSDQNNSATNQFYDHLFSGLTPGYHTFRIISGVDETNSGSNKYGTFDGFVSGTKSDLSAPTTGLSGSEPTSGDTVNDTFYYPAWKDQDDVINTRDSNTKLLLHADGANNATTTYDSALPQKYLTHNGDAKISTAQSKFGGSSYYFDGTGDYISIPDSDDWNLGTGNFTIDTWVMFNSLSTVQEIFAQRTDNSNYVTLHYNTDAGIGLRFSIWSGGVNTVSLNQGSLSGWSTGQWYHVAVVRSGNSWNLYRNGTSIASASTSASFPDFSGSFMIGEYPTGTEYLNGYIDELRITKGVARWTSNFTVPDKPYGGFALTADITSNATSLVLDSENPSDLNKLGPSGVVKIGSEYIRYESKGASGNQATLTSLTRGYGGSTAGAHSNNDAVYPAGGWRNNYYAQQSSWYRENGAFPEKALIVGTGTEGQVQGGLTIVNLENNSTWGKYEAGASNTIKKAVKTVSAVGGKILVGYGTGGSGMTELDFANDMFSTHGSGNDSSTKLLLHGDGNNNSAYIMDSSPSPKTVTAGGVAVSTTKNKFGGSSLYFAGSNYSTLADSDDWYYGTGDFTIDTWVNFSAVNNLRMIYDQGTSVSYYLQFFYSGTSQAFVLDTNTGSGAATLTAPFAASANTWYHVAVVRSSGTAYVFVDGKLIKSGTFDKNLDNIGTSLYIGYNPVVAGDYFYGYMDDYRISKGVARWTSNFAPASPHGSLEKTSDIESYFDGTNYNVWAGKTKDGTAGSVAGATYLKDGTGSGILNSAYKLDGEYENDYYSKLLLHADGTGATFTDSSDPAKTITANDNATQSATQSKFGGKSTYFDGGGDYLSIPDSEDWTFGDSDFTIDFWMNPSGVNPAGDHVLFGQANGSAYSPATLLIRNTKLTLYYSTDGSSWSSPATGTTTIVAGNWYHVTVVRNSGYIKIYLNGVFEAQVACSSALYDSPGVFQIGVGGAGGQFYYGYIDEVRISKGIARWTGTFTAPTRAYENFATKKLEYDSTNNVLYTDQSSGTANLDVWSKITSPKISADSTIDTADGTTRMTAQSVTEDMTQDATNVYFATAGGVKKVLKSTFSSVASTFNSSNLTNLLVDTARTVEYDSLTGKLLMGFSGTSGHNGALVVSGTDGSSPSYLDYFGETSEDSNNALVSDIFNSVSWVNNLVSGYYSFAVGTNQGISLIRYLTSETPGGETGGGGTPKPPAISPSGGGFLIF